MKKFMYLAVALVGTCILFNSCGGVQQQVIVDWGFESYEEPGTIDGYPFASITLKYTQEAIEKEIRDNENWEATDVLGSGGRIVRLAPTTEANTKKELTDLFDTAIKKAEDTMNEMGYEVQPKTETVLAIYKFGENASKLTTLRFTVPVYYAPEGK